MWKKTLDNYEVSDDGRVRNISTRREIKQFVGKDGYMRTQIAGKTRLVHRVIADAYIPKEPGRDFVNHRDGNKQNNSISNLEWCTKSENELHAYASGLRDRPKGIKNGRCKLSLEQIDFIRANYVPRDKQYGAKPLSEKFGVSHQTISAVISGQNWRHE